MCPSILNHSCVQLLQINYVQASWMRPIICIRGSPWKGSTTYLFKDHLNWLGNIGFLLVPSVNRLCHGLLLLLSGLGNFSYWILNWCLGMRWNLSRNMDSWAYGTFHFTLFSVDRSVRLMACLDRRVHRKVLSSNRQQMVIHRGTNPLPLISIAPFPSASG
jgi:hypothetical protein